MAKAVAQKPGRDEKKPRKSKSIAKPVEEKGPVFLIDTQERGVHRLVSFRKIREPNHLEEAKNWEGVLSFLRGLEAPEPQGYQGMPALSIVLFGRSGVGKTSWAAAWPPNTLVIDSLTGMEKLCFQYHCKEYFEDDWSKQGFYSFYQGPKNAAKTDWPEFLDELDRLLDIGWNVVLLAHARLKTEPNPEGEDFARWKAYLDEDIWQLTHRWAQAVLFYNYIVQVVKKGPRAKADTEQSDSRGIYTDWTPTSDGKNIFGMNFYLDAGEDGEEAYEAFAKAFKKAIPSD